MISTNELIFEYEKVLIKRYARLPLQFRTSGFNNSKVLLLFKYVIENMLHWDPYFAEENLTFALIRKLKLREPLFWLDVPYYVNLERDTFYLIHMIYPKIFPDALDNYKLYLYERVLHDHRKRLPRNIFTGAEGKHNAFLFLNMAIQKRIFYSTEDLYRFFANRKEIVGFLKAAKLYQYCTEAYQSPIDFLHDALDVESENYLYYSFYKFREDFERIRYEMRKSNRELPMNKNT